MSKRAERRHHYQRLKKRVEFYYGGRYEDGKFIPHEDEDLGFIVNTRPACSCQMCRNPRHSLYDESLTVQERRAYQERLEDLIHEYYEEENEGI